MPKLFVVIPLYKAPELVEGLFNALVGVADEITALGARVVLINDSPGHAGLAESLAQRLPYIARHIDLEVIENPENLGFVKSANKGLLLGLGARADVVLLNSDTLITPGALTELSQVAALDPLTAVVSPRSNNATICNSPYPDRFRDLDPDHALAAHRAIEPILPRVTYVPTAVGFCLYVRWQMIEEFGVFDLVYAQGYNEENDFIMRCNRRGYRAVLANRAFVFHLGSISFEQSSISSRDREEVNRQILLQRYPEYESAVTRYFTGLEFQTQTLAAGLVVKAGGKMRLLFDCNNVGAFHNGTFELAIKTIRAFVLAFKDNYEFFIACNHSALVFHGFDKIAGLSYCWNAELEMAPFTFCVRLAQPFEIEHLVAATKLAPITSFLVLDTIAMDCQNLDTQRLERVWSHMLQTTTVIGYISEFSRAQFHRRFPVPASQVEYVALCSTDPDEYAGAPRMDIDDGPILLVGNHYAHKDVLHTLDLLLKRPDAPEIVVLGLTAPDHPKVTSYMAGSLDQDLIDSLYDQARIVLFPSHYEGFGFPMTHALGRGKPVIARDLPVFHEIIAASPYGENVHLFQTSREMVEAACGDLHWIPQNVRQQGISRNWRDAAGRLHDALHRAMATLDYDALRTRLQHTETCRAWLQAEKEGVSYRAATSARQLATISEIPTTLPGDDPVQYCVDGLSTAAVKATKVLAKVPPLRALAMAMWKSTSAGRRASWTTQNGSEATKCRSLGRLDVEMDRPFTDNTEFAAAALDWAEALIIGGELRLKAIYDGDCLDPLSPLRPEGVRTWLRSAGFRLRSLEADSVEGIRARAVLVDDWSALLPGPESDEEFIEMAFAAVLDRPADGFGAIHAMDTLRSDGSRRDVMRHLYMSMERALLARKTDGL